MVLCECGAYKLAHRVCPECGKYDGKEVKAIKVKEEKSEE